MTTQSENYVTQDRDMVDIIAFNRFGAHGAEISIYQANPGLVDYGPILPAGLTIAIPVPAVADRTTSDRLWS